MKNHVFRVGEPVVYSKEKCTGRPGPRARDVHPAQRGEHYRYMVDKHWVVAGQREDGKVLLETRRGKRHLVDPGDPHLRPAKWWERLRYRSRFPKPQGQSQA